MKLSERARRNKSWLRGFDLVRVVDRRRCISIRELDRPAQLMPWLSILAFISGQFNTSGYEERRVIVANNSDRATSSFSSIGWECASQPVYSADEAAANM